MSYTVHKTPRVLSYYKPAPNVLISIYKTRYILAKSSKKKFSAIWVATLRKGNIGDALVKGTFQDGLQKTVRSNLDSNGIMGNLL